MANLIMFHRALADFKAAEALCEVTKHNRYRCEVCAFHLEQCVEKVLKGYLDFAEKNYSASTSLSVLIGINNSSESACIVSDWVYMRSDILSTWKEAYLYRKNYEIRVSDLEEAVINVRNFLQMNGVWNEFPDEETDLIINQLISKTDLNYVVRPSMEWHILHRLYLGQIQPQVDLFDLEHYYTALGITDKEAELVRLMNVYDTTNIEVIIRKAKAITELYLNKKF